MTAYPSAAAEIPALLARLGVKPEALQGTLAARSPITGETVAKVREAPVDAAAEAVRRAEAAFAAWKDVPAPRRGELVRLLGEELRAHKTELGRLVTLEAGKILS